MPDSHIASLCYKSSFYALLIKLNALEQISVTWRLDIIKISLITYRIFFGYIHIHSREYGQHIANGKEDDKQTQRPQRRVDAICLKMLQ